MNFRKFKKSWSKLFAATVVAFTLNGCGDSENFVFTNGGFAPIPDPVLQAPVANNDTVVALGNATLSQLQANGVLNNDQVNGAEITSFDSATTNGGTVDLNSDGSFTYTPVFGFTGQDSFTYTLANSEGSSTATVTLNVDDQGWFVNNSVTTNGNGSQANPFDNLPDALAEAGAGDTIFVFAGDGTNNNQAGAIDLPPGVNLIGQANGLVLGQQIEAAGARPVIQGPVRLGGDNTVAGFEMTNSGEECIEGDSVDNVQILNNIFNTPAEEHVELLDVGGTCTISGNSFNALTGDDRSLVIDLTDVTATYAVDGNTFESDTTNDPNNAADIDTRGTTNLTLSFTNNDITSINDANRWDDGLELDVAEQSTVTVSIDGNTVNRTSSDGIDLDTNDALATLTGTVSGNTLENIGDNGIEVDSDRGTISLTVSGNIVRDVNQDGIDLDVEGTDGSVTAIVENNQVTNCGVNGLSTGAEATGSSCTVAFRNNTVTNSTLASLFGRTLLTGEMCLDVTGNTVDDDMIFDNDGTFLRVEQLEAGQGGPLNTVNTFQSGSGVDNQGATSVDDGTCVFP